MLTALNPSKVPMLYRLLSELFRGPLTFSQARAAH
jgi:hypothetical protein